MQCTRGARNRPLRRLVTCAAPPPWGPPRRQQQHSAVTAVASFQPSLNNSSAAAARGHATVAPALNASNSINNDDHDGVEGTRLNDGIRQTRFEDGVDGTRFSAGTGVPRFREGTGFGAGYFRARLLFHQAEQAKVARARERFTQRKPDTWKHIVHTLDKATPADPHRYKRAREKVTLPAGVAAVFIPSTEVAILEIMQQTGCHVQMAAGYAVKGRSNAFTGVFLQGTKSQNTAAWSMLPQYVEVSSVDTAETRSRLQQHEFRREVATGDAERAPQFQFWQVDDDLDGNGPSINDAPSADVGLVRSTWSRHRLRPHPQSPRRTHDASAVHTAVDFTAHVADLIAAPSRVADQIFPSLESAPKNVIRDTIKLLVSLFTDTKTGHLATTESIGHAFEFLVKHASFSNVRRILKVLDEAGRDVGSRGYHALLAGAADKGDIHNFEHVLKSMLRRGRTPDAMTWAIWHGYLCQFVPHEAESYAQLMRSKGLLADNESLSRIVQNTIKQAFMAHIKNEGTAASFLQVFDEQVSSQYGRSDFRWFTVGALNRMLHVLVSLGRMREAITLLEDFRREGTGSVEVSTLNTFLSAAVWSDDRAQAIATLRLFRVGEPGAVKPDRVTYQMLFNIAWGTQSYNWLRVVWRYACAAQQLTYDVKLRMGTSLLADTPAPGDELTRTDLFRRWFAKFAIGVTRDLIQGPHLPYDTSPERDFTPDEQSLIALISQQPSDSGSPEFRERRRQLGRLLRRDVAEAGNCTPMLPLTPVLERAWHKDLTWSALGLGRWDPKLDVFEKMLRHAIRVPMKVGDFTTRRKGEIGWLLDQKDAEAEGKADDAATVKS